MVPAESMVNLESRPLFLTKSLKTPSAAGLLQMFPKHTKRTENGFLVFASVSVVEEAIDDDDDADVIMMGLCLFECKGFKFWRDGKNCLGGGERRNGVFRERKWENGDLVELGGGVGSTVPYNALITYTLVSVEFVYLETMLQCGTNQSNGLSFGRFYWFAFTKL